MKTTPKLRPLNDVQRRAAWIYNNGQARAIGELLLGPSSPEKVFLLYLRRKHEEAAERFRA